MKNAAFLLSIAFLASLCNAQVFVSIEADPSVPALYQDEIASLFITVENSTGNELGIDVTLEAESGLKLFENLKETGRKTIFFEKIPANSRETRPVKIKAESTPSGSGKSEYSITGTYIVNGNKYSVTSNVKTRQSPLSVKFRLAKAVVERNEKNTAFFTFKNTSDRETITGIKAELVLPEGATANPKRIEIERLNPEVELSNESIEFYFPDKSVEENVIARVAFTDSSGFHVLERGLSFAEQDKSGNFAIIAGLIILLALAAIFTRKKGAEKVKTAPEKHGTEKEAEKIPMKEEKSHPESHA